MKEFTFWFLSFFWGYWMTLIGIIAYLVLTAKGYKAKKYNYAYMFEIGENWGGVTLGPVIIVNKNPNQHLKDHEFGHCLQNCYFGPYMVYVGIMSFIRYWFREFISRDISDIPKILKPIKDIFITFNYQLSIYDNVWFEGTATYLGENFIFEEKNLF